MSIKIEIYKPTGELVSDSNQYISYSFDSEYGVTADAFSAVLVDNNADIQVGYEIKFFINGTIGFRGIIERKQRTGNKTNRTVTISGRDRSLILIKSCCRNFTDFNNASPRSIVDSLIAQTNFYTKRKVNVDEKTDSTGFNSETDIESVNDAVTNDIKNNDFLNSGSDKTTYDSDFLSASNREFFKISIGDTVWERISHVIASAGYEALYQENGSLYIGNLEKKRLSENIVHEIVNKLNGEGNNVLEWSEIDDITNRHSTISVYSTPEGNTDTISSIGTATDSSVSVKSYLCVDSNDENESAQKIAIKLREEERQDGYSLEYTVHGHVAENGKIWSINRIANVIDESLGVNESLIINGRTFIYSDSDGTKTILRLGKKKSFRANI